MHCPFYLVIGTARRGDRTYLISTEIDSQEIDLDDDDDEILANLWVANPIFEKKDIVEVAVIANSTVGGPKLYKKFTLGSI